VHVVSPGAALPVGQDGVEVTVADDVVGPAVVLVQDENQRAQEKGPQDEDEKHLGVSHGGSLEIEVRVERIEFRLGDRV
jgi:hypothetical protein